MSNFGDLLRNVRQGAELTQGQLAELAGLGIETVSALERGISNRPRASTVQRLADALELTGDDRYVFEASARSKRFGNSWQRNYPGDADRSHTDCSHASTRLIGGLSGPGARSRTIGEEIGLPIPRSWIGSITRSDRAAENCLPDQSSRSESTATIPLRSLLAAVAERRSPFVELALQCVRYVRYVQYVAILRLSKGGQERYRALLALSMLPILSIVLILWLFSQNTTLPVAASAIGALQVVSGKMGLQSDRLRLTDTGGAYILTGETLTATFSIRNTDPTASHAIALQVLDLSVRGPDACNRGWADGLADFAPVTNIVLKPGEEYKYKQSRSFDIPGIYFMEPTRLDGGGTKWGGIGPFPRAYFAVVDSRTGAWPTDSATCLPLPMFTSVLGGQ